MAKIQVFHDLVRQIQFHIVATNPSTHLNNKPWVGVAYAPAFGTNQKSWEMINIDMSDIRSTHLNLSLRTNPSHMNTTEDFSLSYQIFVR